MYMLGVVGSTAHEYAGWTSPDGRDAAHRRGVVDVHRDREASGDPDH
jgi:hypothetical protein